MSYLVKNLLFCVNINLAIKVTGPSTVFCELTLSIYVVKLTFEFKSEIFGNFKICLISNFVCIAVLHKNFGKYLSCEIPTFLTDNWIDLTTKVRHCNAKRKLRGFSFYVALQPVS